MMRHIFLALILVVLQAAGTAQNNHDFFFLPFAPGGSNSNKAVKYSVYFQYAARWGRPLQTSQFKIYWNDVQLGWITPASYAKLSQTWYLYTKPNQKNILKFMGAGASDGYGVTIDNVHITGSDGSIINVENGDFETPDVGKLWKTQQIPGWKGEVEIGRSHIYNRDWCHTQVVELDAKGNVEISQEWEINSRGEFTSFKVEKKQ